MNEAPEIKVRLTAEDTGVSAAIKELSVQLQDLKRQDDLTAGSADRMAASFGRASGSMREARGSARLLSADLGVGLNRELASTLARSATLGPILSAAFPIVAAIGFYEVLKNGAEQLSTWISDTFIFTKAMKEAYAALQAGNKEIEKSVDHTKHLKEEFELIGLTGIAKDTVLLQRLSDELDKTKRKRMDAEDVLFLNRREGIGTKEQVEKAQNDLLAATARHEEIVQEQYNLEKEILVQQEKDREAAAIKAAQTGIRLEERQEANLAREAAAIRVGMQNELELYKVAAKEREETEKNSFDQGVMTIQAYFARRRETLQSEAEQERAIVTKEIADAQAEADRLGAAGRANQAKSKKAGGPDTEIGALYAAAADKDFANQEANAAKVRELKTKQEILETEFRTKRIELDTEEFQKREENETKILEFNKLIEATKRDTLAAALQDIEIEKQKLTVILQQSGATKSEIAAKVASYTEIKTAQAKFDAEEKGAVAGMKILGDERAAIEDKVKNGKLFQAQADEQLRQLEIARLPVLQQIAAELTAQAKITDDEGKKAQAADFQKQVNAIAASANMAGQQIARIKEGIESSLTGGIEQFFGTLMEGTRNVGQAFRGLAANVVGSLARMMAQMVAQMIVAKMLKAALGGFSGGGLVPGGAPAGGGEGHAGGGLIQGPGSSTSDSIPARLSHGEFVVKADAVKAFGAGNLEAINRGLKIPALERLALPKYAEGGLVGAPGAGNADSTINLGIGLDEGLILKHLSSKAAGNIILNHLANNPKAAGKALSRSQ